MTKNKNIAAIIIIVCTISIIIGIFLPKQNDDTRRFEVKSQKDNSFGFKPILASSPFKGERISVIKLEGVISDSQGVSLFRDNTTSSAALELIIKATKDPSIKAIVIRVNSPGGTVSASQELYQAIRKAKKKKPVVITMGDIAASGGYYIASAGDAIFANPGTLTGSIAVITSYFNFYDLLNKIGVKGITIKSGEYKDIGNPARPLTEEERNILQRLLDDSYEQFISDVAKGRNMPNEKVRSIAKGLIYSGRQAKKAGLVDFIGDYYMAIRHAQYLAKERFPELKRKYKKNDIPLEETWKSASLLDLLTGISSNFTHTDVLENKLLKSFSYSRFQRLWLLE